MGFAAEVKSWWDAETRAHPEWRLGRCEVEQTQEGGRDRSDLIVWRDGVVGLAGELRLPDHPTASPWHPDNLQSAILKARTRGSRWAFTSDGRTLLLLDVDKAGPPESLVVQVVDFVHFARRDELDGAPLLARIAEAWTQGLATLAPVLTGRQQPPGLAADEAFINALRALLIGPVAANAARITSRRLAETAYADDLVRWMVDEQGWSHLPESWDREVQRTAQLSAYVFLTRLMFYAAVRRWQPALSEFGFGDVTADVAQSMVRVFFEHARKVSGDYETVFAVDRAVEYALASDASVSGWRRIAEHIAAFDLSSVDYDVMGRVFERLIDPNERYEWGQHYTQPDVVDLMLSLAIPDGRGVVLDPAVGSGTFLVRAYVRKRVMLPELTHDEALRELYGLEVSAFAANLATINLASRDLRVGANYPRVTVKSFFQVDPGGSFMRLPSPTIVPFGSSEPVAVDIPPVSAVVSNPPYVSHQRLGHDRLAEARSILGRHLGPVSTPKDLPGSPNFHVYFWLHGGQFLRPGGKLVMITSGEWLDSDYGSALQLWLLDNFVIDCMIETLAEPWFTEARVGTVVVSARQCDDPEQRDSNRVVFALLRKPLRILYGTTGSEQEHLRRVDSLRDRILAAPGGAGESDDFDYSAVSQLALRHLGRRSAAL